MESYYLWSGIGAIEDLDDLDDDAPIVATVAALAALKAKTDGDWTLWLRQGNRAILVALWIPRRNHWQVFPIEDADAPAFVLAVPGKPTP